MRAVNAFTDHDDIVIATRTNLDRKVIGNKEFIRFSREEIIELVADLEYCLNKSGE